MGFHLLSVSNEPGIVADDNGCVKTTKKIDVDAELAMECFVEI